MKLTGKKVIIRIGKKVFQGVITRDGIPNQHTHPLDVEVKILPSKKRITISQYAAELAILVPKTQIPSLWKEVLENNPKLKAEVVYDTSCNPPTTTLVDPRNLSRLRGTIHEESNMDVRLWPGNKQISESKPCMEESYTNYYLGTQTVNIEDVAQY